MDIQCETMHAQSENFPPTAVMQLNNNSTTAPVAPAAAATTTAAAADDDDRNTVEMNEDSDAAETVTCTTSANTTTPAISTCNSNYSKVETATRSLLITHQQLEQICTLLENEFKRGLHRETNHMANVKMYPTHIRDQPSNHVTLGHFAEPDEGKFLALDLGGTNFRVVLVELDGSQFHMDNDIYSLSQELMHGAGCDLFDYIADCLHKFVTKRKLNGHRLPLGFTFSFPCQQDGLAHARLVNWTKGFKCSGVEGRDVAELLREAIGRRSDLDIEVMAVVNDTTGTLIACAYQNRECRVGLIVGTGTNACYMEKVEDVHAMHNTPVSDDDHEHNMWNHHKQQTTVVNTEWGAFGDNGMLNFVRTVWDDAVDVNSVNPGKQKFEKMISGLYIGELCRRVMVDMALGDKILFQSTINNNATDADGGGSAECTPGVGDSPEATASGGCSGAGTSATATGGGSSMCFADAEKGRLRNQVLTEGKFTKQFAFETRFVSMIESDPVDEYKNTRAALAEAFGIDWASDEDCAIVKLICTRVSTRAAHLVSAAVACLLNKMGRAHTVVGVDGSMFKYHPHFHSIMAKKTKELTHPMYKFQLMFSEDGSGRGAAIVAAVACKRRRISKEILKESQRKASLLQSIA